MPTSLALTVTQFIELVNAALLAIETVTVEGEIEEYRVIQGKWVVFDLKDKESLVKCFMPVWNLKTELEDGMLVRAVGQPKLRPKGFFSFVLDSVQPAGEGSLKRAFELLKKKLIAEGLFAPERKRVLPRFPQQVALITSRDAAAYGDFLKVLKARHGGLTIYFIHTAVQGEDAPTQIVGAIEQVNTLPYPVEAVVMIRGGGSIEDLQAFNDERVVRAVATSRIPTIVGIGHERDVTLAELAADQRASTPSNAAELLIRSREEITVDVQRQTQRLRTHMQAAVGAHQQAIGQAINALRNHIAGTQHRVAQTITGLVALRHRFRQHVARTNDQTRLLAVRLNKSLRDRLTIHIEHTSHLRRLLQSLSPTATLKRGYSITRLKSGKIVKQVQQVRSGDVLATQVADGVVTSRVEGGKRSAQLELGL